MSVQTVEFVLDRMFKDPALFHRYLAAPRETLAAFDLADDEIEAIASGNRERLIDVGVDERVAGWLLLPKPRLQRQ